MQIGHLDPLGGHCNKAHRSINQSRAAAFLGVFVSHKSYLFTSESVSEGHPDKVCDQISDAVLDAFLENDIKLGIADDSQANTRLGCETLATTNKIVIAGEGRGQAPLFRKHGDKVVVDRELISRIARDVVRDIG